MIASLVSFVSRLSKRGKVVFYGVLVVLSLLMLDRLMRRPILAKMGELDKEITETEVSIRKALGVIDREEELLERASMYAPYLKKPGSDETEKLALVDHIQDLASRSSVKPKEINANLKMGSEAEDTEMKKYVVNLRCEGEMEALVSFFYDIEESKGKLMKIEKFSMVLKGKNSSVVTCTMEIVRYVIR